MPRIVIAAVAVICLLAPTESVSQSVPIMLQERDGAPARSLTAAELNSLADPFFNLVLKEHADKTKLSDIENLITPNRENRQVFVVDENIANSRRGQSRRAVLSFSGRNGQAILTSNVMLSVFFSSEDFSDGPPFIEAWGWDNHRSRYNYYRLDRDGTPDHRMTWKFRGSSDQADLMGANDRRGTCIACHLNGAPVMKELAFPWNNWHSFKSEAKALSISNSNRWPVANSPRLKGILVEGERVGGLTSAERLEVDGILPAITQFNRRRINAALARRDDDGGIRVVEGVAEAVEGKRLLRPLFLTTEFNIVSSPQKSGLHPFSDEPGNGPNEPVELPNALFLNANLLAGGTTADFLGLKVSIAQKFQALPKLTPAEYKSIVTESVVKLGGRPGDADFAFLIPEPSHIDNDLVDQLLKRGIVTPHFVAAVVATDLELPIMSEKRARLLNFIPERFSFRPLKPGDDPFGQARHPDDLTLKVIAAIENGEVATGSDLETFVSMLKSADPRGELQRQVEGYHARIKNLLESDSDRLTELQRLQAKAISLRRLVLNDAVLQTINESGDRLFPLPDE